MLEATELGDRPQRILLETRTAQRLALVCIHKAQAFTLSMEGKLKTTGLCGLFLRFGQQPEHHSIPQQ